VVVTLREASGSGRATVSDLTVSRVDAAASDLCSATGLPRLVPQGGLEEFALDKCPFSVARDSQLESVVVNVRFSDILGRQGSMSTTAVIEHQPPPRPQIEIDLFAAKRRQTDYYYYDTQLILRETAGQAAEITALVFTVPNGDTDSMCRWVSPTISAGQTWNISAMSYCAPYAYSQTPQTSETVYIAYRGLDRVTRTLSQTVDVTSP
jgi:hypothetical protein